MESGGGASPAMDTKSVGLPGTCQSRGNVLVPNRDASAPADRGDGISGIRQPGRSKMKTTTMIGPLLQAFFVEHLLAHKHVSPRTVSSYRDTFRLLLQFVRDRTHTEPSSL